MDSCVLGDLSADAADYEAESWSLAVEPQFCKKQEKRAVKRQDVIYGEQTILIRGSCQALHRFPDGFPSPLVAAQS